MKKLLIVLLALTVIGVLAFADDAAPAAKISLGSWGRSVYNFVNNNGTDNYVSGMGWAGGARVGIDFAGSSENMGFEWNPGYEGGALNVACDQGKIWAKVSPMLKIQLGMVEGDALRGKIGDPGDVLSAGTGNEDNIFKRFYPKKGILIDLTPVDGLYIGAALDSNGDQVTMLASDAYKAIQVGAGYTIANVGLFRAQYIGSAVNKGGKIQAAFAYTGMAGLTADVGATIPMDTDANQINADVGVAYGKDALSVKVRADAGFGATGGAFNLGAYLLTAYTVADPLAAGVEVGFGGMKAATAGTDAKYIDLFPFAKLGYSNGYLKVGFEYKLGLDTGMKNTFSIPLQLEYWF